MQYRDLDKQALKNNGYSVLSKITIVGTNTVFTEDDHIVDWNYEDYRYVPNEGFIGQFVERLLDGTLQDISENTIIENTVINLQLGVVNNLDYRILITQNNEEIVTQNNETIRTDGNIPRTTWYDYGNFLITKVEKEDTTGTYKFESCDYTKKFNILYESTITYPTIALALANDVCTKAEVPLASNSYCDFYAINENLESGNYKFKLSNTYYNFSISETLTLNDTLMFVESTNKLILKKVRNNVVTRSEITYTTSSSAGSNTLLTFTRIPYVDFVNNDFVITSNQYDSEDTLRNVMKDIGKLSYSWIRTAEDNKVHIDFTTKTTSSVDTYDTLTTDEYYVSKKNDLTFGPVNKVLIGMSDVEGENMYETSQDYTPETECAIKIYDNNLTYTEDLRAIALDGCDKLFGITYTPISIDTIGHPWLEGDELIKLTNTDNVVLYTYPFNRSITYKGYIEGNINSSEAPTKQESKYEYKSDIISSVKKTAIIVDKQEQTITAIVANVDENTSNISTLTLDLDGIETRVTTIENTEVTGVTNEYAVNTSATNPPAQSSSDWSTTKPTRHEGEYIWARIKTTYKDGDVEYSDPVNTTGDKGDSGAGISTITSYYGVSTSNTTEPSTWTTDLSTITLTPTNKYLWSYEVIAYSDGRTPTTTGKKVIGVYGDTGTAGRGISSTVEHYLATSASSGVTRSTSGWTTSIQTITSTNKYLWYYQTINYTSGTTTEYTDPIIIGVYGLTGDTGKGITSVTELYYVSSSDSTPTKPQNHVETSSLVAYNTWNLQCPSYTTTYQYFFTCSEILYTDDTYGWTNVVQNQALAIANQNAYDAAEGVYSIRSDLSNYTTTEALEAGLGNTSEEIKSWSKKELVTTTDFGTYKQNMTSELSQKAGVTEITATATQVVNSAMGIDENGEAIEGGVTSLLAQVDETFTFDTNGLKIARGSSSIYLQLQNDRFSFMSGETEKAYMNSNSFVLSELDQLQLGNFAFVVRSNGSLDFKKIK